LPVFSQSTADFSKSPSKLNNLQSKGHPTKDGSNTCR
jgi:hypothetical protein